MHADVQHWCISCHNCQVNGNKKLLYGPRQAVIANGPFEKWGIDAMGPLPRTANGKLYILVAIDYMTRWVEAQSIAKVNEKTVSKFVYTHICCRFGTSLEIVSDNGPGFRRGLLTKICEELKISHRHSTPYYPQSNGLVEKANGIIAGIIRKMVESKPKRWDNFLDGAIWAYRTTYRDATQFTPFHLVYGQEALQPIELNIPTIKLTGRQEQSNDEAWIDRLLNLVELEWKREAAYHCYEKKALQLKDKLNEGIKDKLIKEKSLVLRYNNALDNRFDAKFERRWEGPFIVKKAFTGGYYQLMDLNGKEHPRKVNGYRLKPYLSRILPAVFETKQVSKKTKKVYGEFNEDADSVASGASSMKSETSTKKNALAQLMPMVDQMIEEITKRMQQHMRQNPAMRQPQMQKCDNVKALGMIKDLPTVGSQASLIQHAKFVAKLVKTTTIATSSRATRSSKKSLSDDKRTDTDKERDSQGSDKEESQKGVEAKGPSEHEKSDEEETSAPLDKRARSQGQSSRYY
ncbi:hypothetical protein L7F22_020760 [Adiantum nelumboides]|nr:hypothetical protein [Adiantum nelumboides]